MKAKTRNKIYEEQTLKHLGSNSNGTRMDIVESSMEEYATQQAVEFAEWIADNYSRVYSDEMKISKFVSLDAPIYVHGSDSYRTQLIHTHGKTTKELYELFNAYG